MVANVDLTGLLPALQKKIHVIKDLFTDKKVIVAVSGGIDSAIVLYLVHRYAKEVIGVIVAADHTIKKEIFRARQITDELSIELKEIPFITESIPELYHNQIDRCYYCKKGIIHTLLQLKHELSFDIVAEGTNISDKSDYRPGFKALSESDMISPYLLADINKQEILSLSQYFHFPTYVYPSNSCLATRIPYNIPLTSELLTLVEKAENILYELLETEYCVMRVRLHIPSPNVYCARIEGDQTLFDFVLKAENRAIVDQTMKKLGFKFTTIDLAGYITGVSPPKN